MALDHQQLISSEAYQTLIARKRKLVWPLVVITIGVYMAFILAIAFVPEVLAKPVGDTVISSGILIGVTLIFFNFLITLYYVWRANRDIEPLIQRIHEMAGEG